MYIFNPPLVLTPPILLVSITLSIYRAFTFSMYNILNRSSKSPPPIIVRLYIAVFFVAFLFHVEGFMVGDITVQQPFRLEVFV